MDGGADPSADASADGGADASTDASADGAVVVVTGGANGIGAGVCRAFVRAGARAVWCADVDERAGAALRAELGERLFFRRCDAADPTDIDAFCAAAAAAHDGRVDVLVNNVGVQDDDGTPAHELSLDVWRRVIAVNLTSYFLFAKHCLPHLLRARGVIINMASVQGRQSQPGIPAYAASKGGVLSLTRQLAVDYAPRGVRVVSVSPGTIRTPLVERLLRSRGGRYGGRAALAIAGRVYPVGRIGEVDEVAEACVFLASRRASFITGEDIAVDGGILAKGGWAEVA